MAAGTTIKHKRKAGAFANGELAAGEWGLDVSGGAWYYSINGTTVQPIPGIPASEKGAASGVATLDGTGKIPIAQLPAIAVGEKFTAANQGAMLALTVEIGDIAIRTDLAGARWMFVGANPTLLADWINLEDAADAVTTVFGRAGNVVAATSDYDASQIDNDSGVAGTGVAAALNTLNAGKAATSHSHSGADVNSGDIATARMQTNVAAALQSTGAATINTASLIIDGGTI